MKSVLTIVVSTMFAVVTIFSLSGQSQVKPVKGILSVLNPGQSVSLKESNGLYVLQYMPGMRQGHTQ